MKLTDREKLVLPILPFGIVMGVFSWWFNLVQRPRLVAAQHEHREALAHQVSPAQLARQQMEVTRWTHELEGLEKQKAALDRQAGELCGQLAAESRHLHARQLNDLLARHGLELLDESPTVRGAQVQLPKSLADALERLQAAPQAKLTQVRCLRFSGRFMQVLEAIRELAQSPSPPGIPISLTMTEANPAAALRTWTLVVWM